MDPESVGVSAVQAPTPAQDICWFLSVCGVAGFRGCTVADDPCLEEQYAIENYGTCCAHGGYKIEGHKDVCRSAKAHLVKRA